MLSAKMNDKVSRAQSQLYTISSQSYPVNNVMHNSWGLSYFFYTWTDLCLPNVWWNKHHSIFIMIKYGALQCIFVICLMRAKRTDSGKTVAIEQVHLNNCFNRSKGFICACECVCEVMQCASLPSDRGELTGLVANPVILSFGQSNTAAFKLVNGRVDSKIQYIIFNIWINVWALSTIRSLYLWIWSLLLNVNCDSDWDNSHYRLDH